MTDVGSRLSAPFPASALGWKPQTVKGNRALAVAYIDARDVMDRLDEVVGPENWQDEYLPLPDGQVVCRLSVRLGGEWVTKCDVGGESEQPDGDDRKKAAFSDALKRAAVKWGVGRYLYSLPHQWCDYDPARRQFVSPPQVPARFLPAAGPRPGPAGPPPEDDARRRIREAGTLADLAAVWAALPKAVQALVLPDKDARKAELSAGAAGESDDRLRDLIDERLVDQGRTLADLYRDCGRRAGVDVSRGMPSLADLSGDQLRALLAALDGAAATEVVRH